MKQLGKSRHDVDVKLGPAGEMSMMYILKFENKGVATMRYVPRHPEANPLQGISMMFCLRI